VLHPDHTARRTGNRRGAKSRNADTFARTHRRHTIDQNVREQNPRVRNVRRLALGGIVGPVVFVASWALLGEVKDRYSPIHDAISDLAAVHASTRIFMTAAFVVFSLGLAVYAFALRSTLAGPAWIAALTTGVATLGVAACPLDHSPTVDSLHGVFAGIGYVTLAACALASAVMLARLGRKSWAVGAALAGVLSALSLALTLTGTLHGLFQRAGLTAGDIWIVASAIAIRRRGFGWSQGPRAGPVSG
jgi:hypothetical membrane protein